MKGYARIDLIRGGKVVHRVEHKNTITPAIADLLKAEFIGRNAGLYKRYALEDFFKGCFLVDQTVNTASSVPSYLPSNVNITAHAGWEQNPTTNVKRGNPNLVESGFADNNGYRFIWDWKTSEGNGTIASVCLTHAVNGFNGIGTNESLEAANLTSQADARSFIPSEIPFGDAIFLKPKTNTYLQIHFDYTAKKFTFTERVRSIVGFRINDDRALSEHEVSTTIAFPAGQWNTRSISVDGDFLYFVMVSGTSVSYCKINLTDYTAEDKTITLSFTPYSTTIQYDTLNWDRYPVWNGWMYFFDATGLTCRKVQLSNIANVVELENPDGISTSGGNNTMVQGWIKSGDFLYCLRNYNSKNTVSFMVRNDEIRRAPNGPQMQAENNRNSLRVNQNVNGIFFSVGAPNNNNVIQYIAPNLITTVNNLDTPIAKTPDVSMKLTYTISEV